MQAMVLERIGAPLRWASVPLATPSARQVLVRVAACGVCRTDLHVVDGELADPKLPLIPGHEIVGHIEAIGPQVRRLRQGDRVGIPWLGYTCGRCPYCVAGHENLCDTPKFTGYQLDGGYAEYAVAEEDFCFRLPDSYADAAAAPLLCAGLIGHRCLRMAGEAAHLGIYGFGAAAHIVAQVARHERRAVCAFTRPGDAEAQAFARSLGCIWAGGSDDNPPVALDAAIIFAPVGALLPAALRRVRKGGTVVLGGIHMSDIPAMPYRLLWEERIVRSVANLTRRDAEEFLALAARTPIKTHIETFPLSEANVALDRLRLGRMTGAAVLIPD
jgi:propanol-preferring alcohol dehydrogenase